MKAARAVGSALVAVALLIGGPVALVAYFGPPWPDRLPTRDDIDHWVAEPLNRTSLLAALALFLWAAWILAALAITVDTARLLRRLIRRAVDRTSRHPMRPLLGPLRVDPPRPGVPVKVVAGAVAAALPTAAATAGFAAPATAAPDTPIDPAPGTGRPGPANTTTIIPAIPDHTLPTHDPHHDHQNGHGDDDSVDGQGQTRPGPQPDGWWLPDGSWIALPTALALLAVWRVLTEAATAVATVVPSADPVGPAPPRPALSRAVAVIQRRTTRGNLRYATNPGTAFATGPNVRPSPSPRPSSGPSSRSWPDSATGTGVDIARGVLPAGGIGLTGPGAAAAVRGLLVTALLTRPGAVHILTTAGDWELLAPTVPPPPDVSVLPDLASALVVLEQSVVAATAPRTPRASGPAGNGVAGDRTRSRGSAPVLLISTVPSPVDTARLAIAVRHGHPHGTAAALIGPWPPGTTWSVDHAGRIGPAPEPGAHSGQLHTGAPHAADDRDPAADRPMADPGMPGMPAPASPSGAGPTRITVLTAAACADILRAVQPAAVGPTAGQNQANQPARTRPSAVTPTTARTSARTTTRTTARTTARTAAGTAAGRAVSRATVRRSVRRRSNVRWQTVRRPLSLQILGPAHLIVTATAVPVKLPRHAALEILVLLAVHPDGLDRDSILEALWPDVRHRAAVQRLHTTLSSLRTTMAEITTIPVLTRTDDRYHLNPDAIDVDLWNLIRHADAARGGTPDAAPTHWQATLDLTAAHMTTPAAAPHTRPPAQRQPRGNPARRGDPSRRPAPTRSAGPLPPAPGGTERLPGRDARPGADPAGRIELATGMDPPWLEEHRQALRAIVVEATANLDHGRHDPPKERLRRTVTTTGTGTHEDLPGRKKSSLHSSKPMRTASAATKGPR